MTTSVEHLKRYSEILLSSKNLVLRGAPGTGKTYLAKQIATYIITGGTSTDWDSLTARQKEQVEIVQFHPSFDYSDFVEGLRPVFRDGSLGFELKDGIFKSFVDRARTNHTEVNRSRSNAGEGVFHQRPENSVLATEPEEPRKYVFIIDEINRGEISKIFGELFFSVDPGYRGTSGAVSTQYSNLHRSPDQKFYIPDNVYIIGTMNDIDRSVDPFDFAMRRRFRFIEVRSDERLDEFFATLSNEDCEWAKGALKRLNGAIENIEGLNRNYHVGPSYFLEVGTLGPDALWTDRLEPLLEDYLQGMPDSTSLLNDLKKAYWESGFGENTANENS